MNKKRVDTESVDVKNQAVTPEEAIEQYKRMDKFELLRKIETVSRFVNDPCFDYKKIDIPGAREIIENFKSTYPNKKDYRSGLKSMYEEYYRLQAL